jgi:hypothetical protein
MTNIRFIYLYRDAGNFKQHGDVTLSNELQQTVEEIDQTIRSLLSDGCFFIAQQIQLEERFFAAVNEDDHPWHEFVQVEATTDPTFDPIPEQSATSRSSCRNWNRYIMQIGMKPKCVPTSSSRSRRIDGN